MQMHSLQKLIVFNLLTFLGESKKCTGTNPGALAKTKPVLFWFRHTQFYEYTENFKQLGSDCKGRIFKLSK